MELFYDIYKLFQAVLISGMFISVLLIICTGRISKKIDTKQPLNILRWIIIIYATLGIISLQITFITEEEIAFLNRATGPYWWAYLLMLVCSCVLPFILLHKKLRNNKTLLFIVSLAINIGWLFERLIMGVVSIHRDYLPPGWQDASLLSLFSFFPSDLIPIGISIGLLALIAGNIKTWKNRSLILNKN